jgi:hypothetical protein
MLVRDRAGRIERLEHVLIGRRRRPDAAAFRRGVRLPNGQESISIEVGQQLVPPIRPRHFQ